MKKVIVIDDEACICQVMAYILADDGYASLLGSCEADLRRFLEDPDVVAVICDHTLRGENGLTIQRNLKEELWRRQIVFILLHGGGVSAAKSYFIEHRIFVLEKPLNDTKDLQAKIKEGQAWYAALGSHIG